MKPWSLSDCFRVAASNWGKNHRHHGGAFSALKCFGGTLRACRAGGDAAKDLAAGGPGGIDIVTFSVVPRLTAAWAAFMDHALDGWDHRILIGDSSGAFESLTSNPKIRTLCVLNFPHGEKLDLFLQQFCGSEFVIVSDNDVFWLNNAAWLWALEQFAANARLVAVSLRPREGQVWPTIAERIPGPPMGSYCLIIRRQIWMAEQLSFRIIESPSHKHEGYFFDTADYANVLLLERGYRVLIAPEAIRSSVVTFDGTSCWALRIQQHRGELKPILLGKPALQLKAYLSALVLREMSVLVRELAGGTEVADLVPRKSLDTAQGILAELLEEPARRQAENQVAAWFRALQAARTAWPDNGGRQ